MATYTVNIPGPMIGKQRARVTLRGRRARAYTPARTVNAEAWVRQCAMEQVGQIVLDAPLAITLDVTCEVPASWSARKRAAALSGDIQPTSKPDLDNTVKLVSDALNGVLWRDDSRIVSMTLGKRYGAVAGAVLTVRVAAIVACHRA